MQTTQDILSLCDRRASKNSAYRESHAVKTYRMNRKFILSQFEIPHYLDHLTISNDLIDKLKKQYLSEKNQNDLLIVMIQSEIAKHKEFHKIGRYVPLAGASNQAINTFITRYGI